MTKEDIIQDLYSKTRGKIQPGLDRTLRLAAHFDDPHKRYPIIHIAGTNGKGATVSLLSSVLIEAGYKVGLYTSPHILDFNERIRVDGIKINDKELIDIYEELDPIAQEAGATFFEITTVIAFEYFKRQRVDIAVIETGMGGRWDSTNICSPIATGITYIGMDHQEFLGDTIEKIAAEKAGIIKENTPIATYATGAAEKVIKNKALEESAPYTNTHGMCHIDYGSDDNWDISFGGRLIRSCPPVLPLSSALDNIGLCLAILKRINERFSSSEEDFRKGLENLYTNSGYIGRMSRFDKQTQNGSVTVYLDIAHNPDSFYSQTQEIARRYSKAVYIFGIMADKDIAATLEIIKPFCETLNIYRPPIERAASTEKVKQLAKGMNVNIVVSNAQTALIEAMQAAAEKKLPLIITGSFHMAEAFLPLLLDKIPR